MQQWQLKKLLFNRIFFLCDAIMVCLALKKVFFRTFIISASWEYSLEAKNNCWHLVRQIIARIGATMTRFNCSIATTEKHSFFFNSFATHLIFNSCKANVSNCPSLSWWHRNCPSSFLCKRSFIHNFEEKCKTCKPKRKLNWWSDRFRKNSGEQSATGAPSSLLTRKEMHRWLYLDSQKALP